METNQLTSTRSPMETSTELQQVALNSSKLFVIVVTSVLLTVIITGLAVYFWQKSVNEKVINNLEQKISFLEEQMSIVKKVGIASQSTPSLELSPTQTTANWEEYINS